MPDAFPDGFFDRADPAPDPAFYAPTRLVTHIDDRRHRRRRCARTTSCGLDGAVLDLMGSWVSHFRRAAARTSPCSA